MRLLEGILMFGDIIRKLILRNEIENKKDDENFMSAYIEKHGVEGFKKASARLKSDARFILGVVKTCPECLLECEGVLLDRFEYNEKMVEIPVDMNLFNALCCQANVEAFKFLGKADAKKYLENVEIRAIVSGNFQGNEVSVRLNTDKDYIDLLKYIRYGYLKTDSLYFACAAK